MKTFADFGIEIPYGKSGEVDVTCPECSPERKKSRERCLSVNVEKGTWYCQHCLWRGSLGRDPDWRDQMPMRRTFARPRPPVENERFPAEARAWFHERGIPDDVVDAAGISFGWEYCPQLQERVGTLRFPYLRDGVLVNIKYRAKPKHFWMVKDAERILYGLDGARNRDTLVVVEGEMDKLSMDTVGGWVCLSVPDGAPAEDAQNYAAKFTFLESAQDLFGQTKRVILATDADGPGNRLADELARRIGPEKCSRVRWPEGCKDANEVLVALGAAAVHEALTDAQPYPVEGISTFGELSGLIDDLFEQGFDHGCETGEWPRFDQHFRARAGLLTIVTGYPGSGKSRFLDNLMVRLAERHGWAWGVCSPESMPLERHAAGIMSVRVGKPFDGGGPGFTIGGTSSRPARMSREDMVAAKLWAERRFAFVLPEEPTVEAVLARAKALVFRMGIKGLVIDPWNELDHTRPAGMTETEHVSRSLTLLRNFARLHRVAVFLMAHPAKPQRQAGVPLGVPTLYDCSGGAHFNNKADAGFAVWRNREDDLLPAEIHIQKIRYPETGELGMVQFRYDRSTFVFREA